MIPTIEELNEAAAMRHGDADKEKEIKRLMKEGYTRAQAIYSIKYKAKVDKEKTGDAKLNKFKWDGASLDKLKQFLKEAREKGDKFMESSVLSAIARKEGDKTGDSDLEKQIRDTQNMGDAMFDPTELSNEIIKNRMKWKKQLADAKKKGDKALIRRYTNLLKSSEVQLKTGDASKWSKMTYEQLMDAKQSAVENNEKPYIIHMIDQEMQKREYASEKHEDTNFIVGGSPGRQQSPLPAGSGKKAGDANKIGYTINKDFGITQYQGYIIVESGKR